MLGVLARVFAVDQRLKPSDWAQQHRTIVGGDAPGPWRNEKTPYLRQIMDDFAEDRVRSIAVIKGSQSAGTEGLINMMMWAVDQAPGLAMAVYPDATSSADKNVTRILPQFQASHATRRHLSTRKHDLKRRYIRFDRMDLLFRGSFSEHQLESDPCRYVFVDELDRCPPRTAHLARQRVKTYALGKCVFVGKPGLKGQGIDLEYEQAGAGRHTYRVPCPRCGVYHERTFSRVRWAGHNEDGKPVWDSRDLLASREDVRRTACYKCPHCKGRIGAELNHWQLNLGVWCTAAQSVENLAMAPGQGGAVPGFVKDDPYAQPDAVELTAYWGERPGRRNGPACTSEARGYHIPEWISGVVSNPYAGGAEGFVLRKGEIDQDWLNDHAGLAWSEVVTPIETASLRARCTPLAQGGYRLGQVPMGVLALTAAVDVQDNRCYVEVRGWGERGHDRWLIWHEEVPRPITGDLSVLDEVLYRRKFLRADGKALPIWVRAIDSGDGQWTQDIYAYCRSRPRLFALKGDGGGRARRVEKLTHWSVVDTDRAGRAMPQSVRLLRVASSAFKASVMRMLRVASSAGAGMRPRVRPGIDDDANLPPEVIEMGSAELAHAQGLWRFPEDTGDEYFQQLTAQECAVRLVQGRRVLEWRLREGRSDDHYLSCAIYNEGLADGMKLGQILTREAVERASRPQPAPAPAPTKIVRTDSLLAAKRRDQTNT